MRRPVGLLLALSISLAAVEAAAQAPESPAAPGRFIVHLNTGIVLFQKTGDLGSTPGDTKTLADQQNVLQMFGFGYFFRPNLRLMLSFQLVERARGGAATDATLRLFGVIPWVAWQLGGPFFVGAGPLLIFRNYGTNDFDTGIFTTAGVAFPLGRGFSLGTSVQVPLTVNIRFAISAALAVFGAYRF